MPLADPEALIEPQVVVANALPKERIPSQRPQSVAARIEKAPRLAHRQVREKAVHGQLLRGDLLTSGSINASIVHTPPEERRIQQHGAIVVQSVGIHVIASQHGERIPAGVGDVGGDGPAAQHRPSPTARLFEDRQQIAQIDIGALALVEIGQSAHAPRGPAFGNRIARRHIRPRVDGLAQRIRQRPVQASTIPLLHLQPQRIRIRPRIVRNLHHVAVTRIRTPLVRPRLGLRNEARRWIRVGQILVHLVVENAVERGNDREAGTVRDLILQQPNAAHAVVADRNGNGAGQLPVHGQVVLVNGRHAQIGRHADVVNPARVELAGGVAEVVIRIGHAEGGVVTSEDAEGRQRA